MRIPNRVAAWLCVSVLGMGPWAHAEDESSAWELPSLLEESCGERSDAEGDGAEGGAIEPCRMGSIERRHVFEDVFEYSYRVRVGSGAYDFITLHRVVREGAPGVPLRTPKSVFLVHGDVWGFRGAFLGSMASGAVPRQQSFAVFLARRGVDVWGIDLRWVNVPPGTTDFSFMKGWNLGLHARDVGTGLMLARGTRASEGSGGRRMVLLGWSRGATVSYAWLNEEARVPLEKRQVSGFIPVDMAYKFAPEDEALRQSACQSHATLARDQAAGLYEGGALGQALQGIGTLAILQPQSFSSLLGFTNRQVALVTGAATFTLQSPAIIPSYHFTGGQFDLVGIPTGLSWTRERFYFDTLLQASPYQSLGEQVDTAALWCGTGDLPYDDHLSEVIVPVLYVGGAGGMGRYGLHTLSLLGSRDVSSLVVRRFPDAARVLDYGHSDLFLADDAEATVWTPVLQWLERH